MRASKLPLMYRLCIAKLEADYSHFMHYAKFRIRCQIYLAMIINRDGESENLRVELPSDFDMEDYAQNVLCLAWRKLWRRRYKLNPAIEPEVIVRGYIRDMASRYRREFQGSHRSNRGNVKGNFGTAGAELALALAEDYREIPVDPMKFTDFAMSLPEEMQEIALLCVWHLGELGPIKLSAPAMAAMAGKPLRTIEKKLSNFRQFMNVYKPLVGVCLDM